MIAQIDRHGLLHQFSSLLKTSLKTANFQIGTGENPRALSCFRSATVSVLDLPLFSVPSGAECP